MSKYDLTKVVEETQKLYSKDKLGSIGTGNNLKSMADGNFLEMPEWWQKGTNTKGIPFGGYVMLAGDTDSGKTSACIEAMKAAQKQDVAVLYVESENKTTEQDLLNWGVDTSQIMLVKSSIAEDMYSMMFKLLDNFLNKYPTGKILLIMDNIGNVVSKHDMESDMSETNQKPGGKGKTNRAGMNSLVARFDKGNIAGLIINYTYVNMGSPGLTNAGGRALNLFSSMTYQTSRKAWLEKTVRGEKIRIGAKVQWKLYKNHIRKDAPGPKIIELDITSDGIKLQDM